MSTFAALLKPVPTTTRERKEWGLGVMTHILPMATALRATGKLDEERMPDTALGRPMVYTGINPKTGRPMERTEAHIRAFVASIQANFISQVWEPEMRAEIEAAGEKYGEAVAKAKEAAAPLIARDLAAYDQDKAKYDEEQARLAQLAHDAELAEQARQAKRDTARLLRQAKQAAYAPAHKKQKQPVAA